MGSHAESALEMLRARIGEEEGPGEWHTVDQDQIQRFADATLDHQFIHVDPERAARTPFGTTIAHGFLTLSLLPHLQASIAAARPESREGLVMAINYGLDKVRFPSPVKVDSRIRARRSLEAVEAVGPSSLQLKQKVVVEIEDAAKPACVAEFLTRLVYR